MSATSTPLMSRLLPHRPGRWILLIVLALAIALPAAAKREEADAAARAEARLVRALVGH